MGSDWASEKEHFLLPFLHIEINMAQNDSQGTYWTHRQKNMVDLVSVSKKRFIYRKPRPRHTIVEISPNTSQGSISIPSKVWETIKNLSETLVSSDANIKTGCFTSFPSIWTNKILDFFLKYLRRRSRVQMLRKSPNHLPCYTILCTKSKPDQRSWSDYFVIMLLK